MIFGLFVIFLSRIQGYEERLTIVPIDAGNSLYLANFTDSAQVASKPFKEFNTFPVFLWQMLQHTQEFSINLAWGRGETIANRLEDYKFTTNREVSISQPGLSGYFYGKNWENFKSILSGALSVSFSKRSQPVFYNSKTFFSEDQFLCKENFEKILDWLPCRESGLSSTLDQLLTSKYLNIHLNAFRDSEFYFYNLIVSALKKEKISGVLKTCNTKVEIFEDQILADTLNLNRINLSPVKAVKSPKFLQNRWIIDQEHGFSARFFHEFSNESDKEMKIIWFETFPVSVVPLLSTTTLQVREIQRNTHGWVLKFEENLRPGKLLLEIQLEKQILSFEEYPNDPQRGWDVLPAVVFSDGKEQMSNGLLIMIPEPDFSMPFNVICITGSAIAFFFTSFQNLQTWKDSVHWSDPSYESSILKAKKRFTMLKNGILVVSLSVLFYLDQKGIIKMFG